MTQSSKAVALMIFALLVPLAVARGANPDERAAMIERQMTDSERIQLLHGIMPIPIPIPGAPAIPPGIPITAGYIKGVERLGIPDMVETDASLGIANPLQLRVGDTATALPAGLAIAATFDEALAFECGAAIGAEARTRGFNVLLGGGANLARDPRNGRNFEYYGEDPLLTGTMAGAAIRGTQSQHVVSTLKHFALNDQETLRNTLDARIAEAALRESDLLAFEIALERGNPGAVMCAYNRLNGEYSCGNDALLNGVLKRDWGFKGWVMSDWGAVGDVSYFSRGLDQESGEQLDKRVWFGEPLRAALAEAQVPHARVSDAVRRILRSLYAVGVEDKLPVSQPDYAAHAIVARRAASEGMVLLKNDGALPLSRTLKNIVVIGGHSDIGVLSGAGSSQVTPRGHVSTLIPVGGPGAMGLFARQLIVPSSPLGALKAALPATNINYQSGYDVETAAAAAAHADLVIVFATKWQTEGFDSGSLRLPEGQDELIATVARANGNVVVVLETGNPVLMPWLASVRAVLEAWYPGQEGGPAIADVLTGVVNPSGRLPMTFPMHESHNERPAVPGLGMPEGSEIAVDYTEGSDVGYRWFARRTLRPLFPFGYGLSYTKFEYGKLMLTTGRRLSATLSAKFTVRNAGQMRGADVPQIYVLSAAGSPVRRLVDFARVELDSAEEKSVTVRVDPRLLAHWDLAAKRWRVDAGEYVFGLATSAEDVAKRVKLHLSAREESP